MSKSRRSRSRHGWLLLVPCLAAMGALGVLMMRMWRENEGMQTQAREKNEKLFALRRQLGKNRARLNALQGPRGREIILRERGYIRPDERILLFPDK